MTETEAHHFLKKCQRIWLRGKNLPEDQLPRKMEEACRSTILGMLLFICIGVSLAEQSKSSFLHYYNLFAVLVCVLVLAAAGWTWLRLRRINQGLFNHKS